MNKEDIIKMARKAGVAKYGDGLREKVPEFLGSLERFAALVAAAEREACAKVCDDWAKTSYLSEAKSCARIIRERGESK